MKLVDTSISLLKVLLLRRDDYGSRFKFIRTLLVHWFDSTEKV